MAKVPPPLHLRERSVMLSDLAIRLSYLPLEALLRGHGIDPTFPYREEYRPKDKTWIYRQPLRLSVQE